MALSQQNIMFQKSFIKLLIVLFGLLFGSACHGGEISGSLKSELELLRHSLNPSIGTLEISLDGEFELDEQHYFNFVIFDEIQYSKRATTFNNNEGETDSNFEFQDLTLRGWRENFDWIVGKQIVSWGKSDGLRILDIINPIYFDDFLKFDFEEMKKSLWLTNFRLSWQDSYLQLLLIPEHRSNQSLETVNPLVGVQQNLSARGINVSDISKEEYDLGEKISVGIEFGTTLDNDFDFTFNILKTYEQDALIQVGSMMIQNQQPTLTLRETFPKKVMIGGSFSTQFLDWVLRGELGYFPNRYFNVLTEGNLSIERYNNLVYLVGADYSYNDWFFSVQYVEDRASTALLARAKSENITTVSLSKQFLNETLKIGFKGFMSTNNHSGIIQPYLNYSLSDRMSIRFLITNYFGSDGDIFSSLSRDDFIRLAFKFEF
jgi:hypothetical protein